MATWEKIISCREFFHAPAGTEPAFYEMFKERAFEFYDLTMTMAAAKDRYITLGWELNFDAYAIASAMIHQEGISGCGELAFEAALIAQTQMGLFTLTIILDQGDSPKLNDLNVFLTPLTLNFQKIEDLLINKVGY